MVKKSTSKAAPSKDRKIQANNYESIDTEDSSFPIVGIGASAGGLEACSEFFAQLPVNTGMAFVLVQHLDPSHKSMLTELLSRTTQLPISEVVDGMMTEPNHIYIIPPNTELGILHNVLHLLPRSEVVNPHLPIDSFMQSLAEDQGSMAIGVILSGGASDGTIGLKRIKAAGGITFAQDETSAKYNSMPHSAIAAGCVDFVLTPAEIAKELIRIARQPRVLKKISGMTEPGLPDEGDELNKIFMLLRNHTGNDFTYYKHSTICRRIQRRMVLHKLERLKDYLRYLREHCHELDELFQDILINVTGFFRDPDSFDALKQNVFPAIIQGRKDETLRIWVAGCSTGEEAYSIAMALLEYLGDQASGTPIQIFASDIDAKAIDKARVGIYPEGIKADVSAARLQRFFTKVPAGYQISKSIRDLCLFAVQNVAKDPPFSRMDLISCRNLLIYFSSVMQKKVLQVFHYALKASGFLLLGGSESISGSADLFSMLDKKNKIYNKKSITSLRHYEFSSMPSNATRYSPEQSLPQAANTLMDIVQQAERFIINEYGPAAVIINQDLDILHFRGHTGPYIEPAQGSASLNLMKMARTDLLMELRSAIRQTIKEGVRVRRNNVRFKINHDERRVHLQVIPLKGPRSDECSLLVLFEEADSTSLMPIAEAGLSQLTAVTDTKKTIDDKDQRITALEQELTATREYLQTIIEDQETANEELQPASEEIQSANEELQSTSEELETAKEELQSTNEELVTVNDELEGRNVELSQLNNDLNNLLNSVQLPIIMLNEDLSIRHFTPGATQLFNLIHSDVGRPISDIKANVEIPNMEEHLMRVMDTVMLETLEVRDSAGNWYNLRIRPYKTIDNRIAGVVLVFVGMSSEVERRLAAVVRDASDAITLQDFDGNILAWNSRAEQIFGYSENEALAMNVRSLIPESARLNEAAMVAALRRGEEVASLETVCITKDGQTIKVLHTSTALIDEHGQPYAIAATERLLKDKA